VSFARQPSLYLQIEAKREQHLGNSLIFAERSGARARYWQFAYLFIRKTKRSESSVLAIRLSFYSQNKERREQRVLAIRLFAERSEARAASLQLAYSLFAERSEARAASWQFAYKLYFNFFFLLRMYHWHTIYIKQNKKTATRLDPWEIL